MKKTPVIVTALATALVLGGGTSAYALTNEVHVNAYGEQSTVRQLNGTVQDVLAAQGITPAATDAVTPALSTPVTDDTHIVVTKRQAVTVTVDGTEHRVLTPGTTVQDALDELELPVPEGAVISPAPSTPLAKKNAAVSVTTPKSVTFVGQNGQATMEVTETTVGEAGRAHLVDIQDGDVFDPGAESAVTDGMTVHVTRLRERDVTTAQEVDFSTVTKDDPDLEVGTERVQTEGQKGSKDVVVHEKLTDGQVTERTVVSETVTVQPTDRVVLKGTKEKAPEPTPVATPQKSSSSSSSSSAATEEPAAATPAPSPSPSSSQSSSSSSDTDQGGTPVGSGTTCTASHYGLNDGTDGGPTASGETFHASAMTAAHKTLPLGTRIRVTNNANGQSVVVRINDRGPYISGRCLDLSSGAFNTIGSTSSGTMSVTYQVLG